MATEVTRLAAGGWLQHSTDCLPACQFTQFADLPLHTSNPFSMPVLTAVR